MDTVITRTLGSGTATTKFTYSTWVKRTALGVYGRFFTSNGTGDTYFRFDTADILEISGDSSSAVSAGHIKTNRLFRDPAAWYHIVVRFDSSESLANDRLRLYINGVDERNVGGYSTDTMPNSAVDDNINLSGNVHRIGGTAGQYFGGSMSHTHLCIGYSYAPTEFGEVDSTSGIWKIKTSPSVSYGTNGFFLKMEDRTNLDLDSSPNANTFSTAGTLTPTYDSPSNNFCIGNNLDHYSPVDDNFTWTNGSTTILDNTDAAWRTATATQGLGGGKLYFEAKLDAVGSYGAMGVIGETDTSNGSYEFTGGSYGYGYYNSGQKHNSGTDASYGDTYTTADIIGCALDLDNLKIYFSKNGVWQDSGDPTSGATGTGAAYTVASASSAGGFYMPCVGVYSSTKWSYNFGNGYFGTTAVTSANADDAGIGAMEYDVPAGYYCLCTKNIKAYGG